MFDLLYLLWWSLGRLYSWLQADPVGRQFRTSFLWDRQTANSEGPRLAAWKFTYWLPHSLDAYLLLDWFKHTQKLIADSSELFESYAFTPLALLWESDPFTVKSTVNSLLSALLAIIFVRLHQYVNVYIYAYECIHAKVL